MKAILKFNLPEEKSDFNLAIKAHKYFSTVWDVAQAIRDELKHGSKKSKGETLEELYEIVYYIFDEGIE